MLLPLSIVVSIHAVERDNLWLPLSYKKYFTQLRRAADLAEKQILYCEQVIDGSLNLDLSRMDAPFFRLMCKDAEQRRHILTIDGLTLDLVDPSRPSGRISFEQLEIERIQAEQDAIEAQKIAEAEALEQQQAETYAKLQQLHKDVWQDCQKQLTARTQNMKGVVWLTTRMPAWSGIINDEQSLELKEALDRDFVSGYLERNTILDKTSDTDVPSIKTIDSTLDTEFKAGPDVGSNAEVEPEPILFTLDFNAVDLYNKDLHYQGFCHYRTLEDFSIKIRPRR